MTIITSVASGAVKGHLQALASATALVANTTTAIAWSAPYINAGEVIVPTTTTISLPRVGLWQILISTSIQSTTANARGAVLLQVSAGTIFGPASNYTRAIRLGGANVAVEQNTDWIIETTSATTNISVAVNMTAASQVNTYNSTPASATTTRLTILEIG